MSVKEIYFNQKIKIKDLQLELLKKDNLIKILEQEKKELEFANVGLGEVINQKTDLINKMQLASYTPKLVQDNIKILKDGTNE